LMRGWILGCLSVDAWMDTREICGAALFDADTATCAVLPVYELYEAFSY